jgi:glycosyltransferase involved in cell wall biosynthesis
LNGNQRLVIVDNCSDVPVQETLDNLLDQFGSVSVRIIRNPINVGGGANILRCLEICETQWLYCLGDDDLVAHDCISTIERTIAAHEDALYFSFSRDSCRRREETCSEGMAEFVDKLDDWSTFLFMSSAVVNAAKLRSHIRWGYLYAYSWAPFQAILFKTLNCGGKVVFSDAVICHEESLAEETWVPFPVAAGKMVLPELVDDKALRLKLARRLMDQPSLPSLIYWARVKGTVSAQLDSNRLFVGLYIDRCVHYIGSMKLRIYKVIAFVMLRPSLLPSWLFCLLETLIFKAMRRAAPDARPMNHDRA